MSTALAEQVNQLQATLNQTTATLHRSQAILQAHQEGAIDGILVLDEHQQLVSWNSQFRQLWAISESTLLTSKAEARQNHLWQQMLAQLVQPEQFMAQVESLGASLAPFQGELCFTDGRILDWRSIAVHSDGAHYGSIWYFRNISRPERTEIALRESEFKFRSIVENANDILFVINSAGIFSYVSPDVQNIMGFAPAEMEEQSFALFIYPEDLPQCLAAIDRVVTTGERQTGIEYRARYKDRQWYWQVANLAPSQDANGNALIVGVARDITDYKRAEAALRASEAQYRDLVQTANSIILRWDTQGDIKFINEYGQRFLGFCFSELVGCNVVGTIVPETETSGRDLQQLMADICQHPENHLLNENENLCRNGDRVWIAWANKPILDSSGNLIEILSVGTDATERKRAQIALQKSEAQLQAILNNANAAIFVKDLEGRYLFANRELATKFNSPPEEILGKTDHDLLPLAAADSYRDNDLKALEAGTAIKVDELNPFDTNQQTFVTVKFPLLDASGAAYAICGIATDISELKQSEERLRQQQEFLRTVIDTDPNYIFVKDWEGRYLLANKAAAEFYNMSVEELVGQRDVDFHPSPTVVAQFIEENRQVIETGQELFIPEERVTNVTDREEWLQWQKRPLRLPGSSTNSVLGIGVNITERKQAEAALRLSELKYRNLFENSQVGIGRTRIKEGGLFLEANQRCAEIMGHKSAAELIGKRMAIEYYVNPDDRERIIAELERCGEVRNFELPLRRPDGLIVWTLLSMRKNFQEDCTEFVLADISERKRLEEELRRSQQFLDSIIDSIPLAIFVKDVRDDFRYVLINKNSEKVLGVCRDGAIGRNDYELIDREQADFHRHEDQSVVEQKKSVEFPEQWVGNHSEQVLVRGWKLPLFDAQGQMTHLLAISEDITERKRREQALRLIMEGTAATTGSDFFHACVQSLAEVLQVRHAMVVEFVSGTKTKARTLATWTDEGVNCTNRMITDSSEFSVKGTPSAEVLTGKTCYYPQNVRTMFPADAELAALGAESYFGVPLVNATGGILGNLAVIDTQAMENDLGRELILKIFAARAGAELERKRTETALQRRAQLDSLLSNISRQFIDQDMHTATCFTLEAIAHFIGAERSCIFEYSEDQNWLYLIDEWCVPELNPLSHQAEKTPVAVLPDFHRQISSGITLQVPSVAALSPDSPERHLFDSQMIQSVIAVPMLHGGKVRGFLRADVVHTSKTWNSHDIKLLKLVGELIAMGRSRHQAEAALRLAKDAAEAANRAKSAFLANMSHELRTPLNAILGFAQLMERDPALTSRQQSALATINRSGEHLLNLINDVLEMSKIEAGRIALNPAPFDLHQLLQTLQEMFQVRAEAKQLTLEFAIASDLPQYIITDEGKLRQVLINLLSNAVKFTQSGRVMLRASRHQSVIDYQPQTPFNSSLTLHFEIEDTGHGIAPDERDSLFQPFVQTMSGTEAREGTGLGLTISRQFVQLMGGEIGFSSALGQGSTFAFTIQATLTDTPTQAASAICRRVLKLAPDQPAYRILVVDDRAENRDLIEQLLQLVGFEIQTATQGQEAIELWQSWHPHLIWMDMRMPVMNGYEATRQIRSREVAATNAQSSQPLPLRTKIIALTASAFEEQQANILASGCDDFVRKPFREQVIFEKMAEHLGVRYLYEDQQELEINNEPNSSAFILQPSALQILPAEWLTELQQAAIEVDADRVLQLLQQIPQTHLALAESLRELVNRYCYDEILELAEAAIQLGVQD